MDADAFAHRGRWRERVGAAPDAWLIVEVGCAAGELLARVAATAPSSAFVGIDWKYGDALHATERVAADDLRNVAIIRGRAQDLRRTFADGEVDEIWVFHPEPVDDRLFAEPFLLDARAVLRDARSTITLKTDHLGYAQATLALLGVPEPQWASASPRARLRDRLPPQALPATSEAVRRAFAVAAISVDFWNDEAAQRHADARAFAGERTPYETRFVAKRRPIFYVELRPRALRSPMEPMKPMQPMKPMEPMKPLDFGPPWWPASYGTANAAGGQNDVRYVYFGDKRRLLVDAGDGATKAYDTGDHQISGIQQSQGGRSRLVFSSQHGPIALDTLTPVDLER